MPSIERTLSNVGVSLEDLVVTPLDQKGTGVRGGVLGRDVELPGVERNPRDGLCGRGTRSVPAPSVTRGPPRPTGGPGRGSDDVTLLVTTHSPYLVSRSHSGRVFCLAKDTNGRTRLAQSTSGDASHAPLIGDLFRESTLADLLAQATELPAGAAGVLIVEGDGDEISLRLAADVVNRPDLLEGIHIQPRGKRNEGRRPGCDQPEQQPDTPCSCCSTTTTGKDALKLLASEKFGFQKNQQVTTYAAAFPTTSDFPYEAEDVFDPAVIDAFVENFGNAIYDGSQRRPDGAFHYDLDQSSKALLGEHLASFVRPEHLERWIELILLIRSKLGLPQLDETAADIVRSAPEPQPKHQERTEGRRWSSPRSWTTPGISPTRSWYSMSTTSCRPTSPT